MNRLRRYEPETDPCWRPGSADIAMVYARRRPGTSQWRLTFDTGEYREIFELWRRLEEGTLVRHFYGGKDTWTRSRSGTVTWDCAPDHDAALALLAAAVHDVLFPAPNDPPWGMDPLFSS